MGSTLTWPSTAAILARGARDPANVAGTRLEPERGFEPLTYHLRGRRLLPQHGCEGRARFLLLMAAQLVGEAHHPPKGLGGWGGEPQMAREASCGLLVPALGPGGGHRDSSTPRRAKNSRRIAASASVRPCMALRPPRGVGPLRFFLTLMASTCAPLVPDGWRPRCGLGPNSSSAWSRPRHHNVADDREHERQCNDGKVHEQHAGQERRVSAEPSPCLLRCHSASPPGTTTHPWSLPRSLRGPQLPPFGIDQRLDSDHMLARRPPLERRARAGPDLRIDGPPVAVVRTGHLDQVTLPLDPERELVRLRRRRLLELLGLELLLT